MARAARINCDPFYFWAVRDLSCSAFCGPADGFLEGRRKYVPNRKKFPFGIRGSLSVLYMISANCRYHINLIMALVAPSWEYLGRFFYASGDAPEAF